MLWAIWGHHGGELAGVDAVDPLHAHLPVVQPVPCGLSAPLVQTVDDDRRAGFRLSSRFASTHGKAPFVVPSPRPFRPGQGTTYSLSKIALITFTVTALPRHL